MQLPASHLPAGSGRWRLEACSERRSHREPELVLLFGLEVVVEHARTRRVHREDQPERHVQHRHEEPDFGARRDLERGDLVDRDRDARQRVAQERQNLEHVARERRQAAWRHLACEGFLPREVLALVPNLAGVGKQDEPHRARDADQILGVEQQALVAADDQLRCRIARADAADIEAANAVFAPEEQFLENRQLLRAAVRRDVLHRRAEPDRGAVSLLLVPDGFCLGIDKVAVPAQAGKIERRGETPTCGREDRVVDRVVDVARTDLADAPLPPLIEQQRVCQERIVRVAERRRLQVRGVQVLDADVLVAVVDEKPRERSGRESPHRGRALGRLGVRPEVLDFLVEDVDAGGDRPVEQERLGEAHLVVLRAIALLQRDAEGFAAPHEIRRLERELPEEPFVLRDARAERDLVAVLLFELQLDVDLVLGVRRLLNVNRLTLQVLEVAELIQPPDAVLQRFGVEDVAFEQPDLSSNDVVARCRVADECNAMDEVLLAFLHPHGDVDDRLRIGFGGRLRRRGRGRWPGRSRGARAVAIAVCRAARRAASGRRRWVARERQVGIANELEIATAPVQLTGLVQTLPDQLLVVPIALIELEERTETCALYDGVAREVEFIHPVTLALGDGNLELDEAVLAVLRILQDLQLGLTHTRFHVALLAIVPDDLFGIVFELRFLVGAGAGDELQEPRGLVLLHLAPERPVADGLVADEVDAPNLDLRAFGDVEREIDDLRAAGNRLDLRLHLGVFVALLGI